MTGPKTNEREGTRAVLRYAGMSAYKARTVLDLIRGKTVAEAIDILRFTERDVANHIGKLVASAAANAENNDGLDREELFVSACFADEGTTMKRWRPRARGRAGRIRKRTCHITVVVSRLPEDKLARLRAAQAADVGNRRARRVAGARAAVARSAGGRDRIGRRRGGDAAAEGGQTDVVEPEVIEAEVEQAVADTEVEEAAGIVDQTGAAVQAEAGPGEASETSEPVVDSASAEGAPPVDDIVAAGDETDLSAEAGAGSAGPAEAPENSPERSDGEERSEK